MMKYQNDFERLGIFKEMPYHTIGDPYRDIGQILMNRSSFKGKQMIAAGPKKRSALSDGYFSEFARIYDGDSKIDVISLRRRQRLKDAKRKLGKDWIPPPSSHKLMSSGSYLDTFSGPVAYFKPSVVRFVENKTHAKNICTSPGKKGNGSYIDITIGKYPQHKPDPYTPRKSSSANVNKVFYLNLHPGDFFDSNPYKPVRVKSQRNLSTSKVSDEKKTVFKPSSGSKTDGGCKDGCFNPFPSYSTQRPKVNRRAVSAGPAFHLYYGPKSYPIYSIMQTNINRSVNSANYKTVRHVLYS